MSVESDQRNNNIDFARLGQSCDRVVKPLLAINVNADLTNPLPYAAESFGKLLLYLDRGDCKAIDPVRRYRSHQESGEQHPELPASHRKMRSNPSIRRVTGRDRARALLCQSRSERSKPTHRGSSYTTSTYFSTLPLPHTLRPISSESGKQR